MPSVTGLSVLDEARNVYLNDPSAALFTNTVLTPFLRSAYEDFRNECAMNGISEGLKIASPVTIAIGTTTYTPLPTDLLLPIELGERAVGSTDPFTPMQETRWEPDITPDICLNYWSWRDSDIKFVGATTDRVVQLKYYWDFTPETVDNTTTDLRGNGRAFLSAKVAAKAHKFINQNDSLASDCNQLAEVQLQKIIRIMVRNRLNIPAKQQPFGRTRLWGIRN